MKRLSAHLVLTLACVLWAFAVPGWPQGATTGNITGRATDGSGAVIPGVDVTITSPAMIGGTRSAVTDERGSFRFTELVSGTYRVSFALPGFQTLNIEGNTVAAGKTLTVNGILELASVAEEVTVTSAAPTIDLESATVGVNWDTQKLEDLPYARSLKSFTQMMPGIFFTSSYDVGGSSFATTSGVAARTYGRTGNNVVAVDGLIWCQGYMDYGAFEEVNVSTASKGADQMNAGVTMNLVIKSGSNQFHGNASVNYERGSFQGHNVDQNLLDRGFTAGSNKFTRLTNLYGDVGGPILRDKLWFYISYLDGYQGNFIPGYIGIESGQPEVFYSKLQNPTAKLTYQLTSNQKLDASWQINRKWQPYRGAGKYRPLESTQDQDSWATYGPNLKWTYIIGPKMTATAGINRGGYWWPDVPWSGVGTHTIASYASGIPTLANLNDVRRQDRTTGALVGPQVDIYRRPIRWTWNGDISWFTAIGGKENEVKFGYYSWWDKSYTTTFGYPNQQLYRYLSLSSEDFVDSTPEGFVGLFQHPDSVLVYDYPNTVASGGTYKAFYLNDKINLSRKLTVTAGFRFDRFTSFLPQQGRKGEGPVGLIPDEFTNPVIYPDRRDFPIYTKIVPRLSFAYDITGTGRFALKASYGRYTSASSSPGSQPGDGASNVNPNSTTTCTYLGWTGDIPFRPATSPYTSVSCSGGGGSAGIKRLSDNLDANYLDEYTAGIDIGFTRDYSLRFNVVRKFDRDATKTLDLAQPFEAWTDVRTAADRGRDNILGTADDGPAVMVWSVPKSYPTQGQIDTLVVNNLPGEGTDQYTAYETTFNKQPSNKWSFLASYTLSMRHENGTDALNPNQLFYRFDLPIWDHAMKFNGTYRFPFGFQYGSTWSTQSGNWYGRSVRVRNALGSNVTVTVESQVDRYGWVHLWDQRFSKKFQIAEGQTIEADFDLFNTLNVNTVTSQGTTVGLSSYMRPSAIIAPRIFQLSAKYKF
jgi:Carboxypeptidase regulatory-like domain